MCNTITNFWELIQESKIIIPIIQRDYAQGRKGKEFIRKNFLRDIKNALENKSELTLDFIYGTYKDHALYPLDGQQRLTTLWLIHWYIAYESGNLEEHKDTLQKFSYETRSSAREFCMKLCVLNNNPNSNEEIVPYITKQNWFFSIWKQDPTVQSMLRMLSGAEGKELDGIEKVFKNCNTEDYKDYWSYLTNNCLIKFSKMEIKTETLPVSDDLYIKMNARGKSLSDFENFKADFVNWIYHNMDPQEFSDNDCAGYVSLIDNSWTDIFWLNLRQDNESNEKKVDEIYFAFLNRYFLNELIVDGKDKNNNLYTQNFLSGYDKEQPKEFDYFYGTYFNQNRKNNNDNKIAYKDFTYYDKVFQESLGSMSISKHYPVMEDLKRIFSNLNNLNGQDHKRHPLDFSINDYLISLSPKRIKEASSDEKFYFIPQYESGDIENLNHNIIRKISGLSQQQHVIFFAIGRYLAKIDHFDEVSFSQWLRVVWNIAENTNLNSTISEYVKIIRLIDKLSKGCHNIYAYLVENENVLKSEDDQVEEEIIKAKKILGLDLNLPAGTLDTSWEKRILDAENTLFFNGAIRFLYTGKDGKEDWNNFDTKLKNSTSIFDQEGISPDYQKEAKAIRILLSYCDNWCDQVESATRNYHYIFSFSKKQWRNYILLKTINKQLLYASPIHHLLIGDSFNSNAKLKDGDDYREPAFDALLNTNIIKYNIGDKFYVRWIYSNLCLYPSSEGVILSMQKRDAILNSMIDQKIITLIKGERIESTPLKMFKGWNIKYEYSGVLFQWQHFNWIDLYIDDQRIIDLYDKEEGFGLAIDGTKITGVDDLKAEMDRVIKQYNSKPINL